MRHVLLLVAVLCIGGCGDTVVDPFLRDAQPYSLYGLIVADVFPRTQRVRVQRVRALVEPPTDPDEVTRQIDGEVRSVDPRAPSPLLWTRRTVAYDDGTVGVVFERSFQAVPDSRLTLTYQDLDGQSVEAEVVFPSIPTGVPLEVSDEGTGAGRRVTQPVAWDARLGETVDVIFQGAREGNGLTGVVLTYDRSSYDETGQVVEVDLRRGIAALREVEDLVQSLDGSIPGFQIQMIVTGLSDDLPAVGVTPRDDLGRAFVAGATIGRLTWTPPVDTSTL